MAKIKVRYFGRFRRLLGKMEEEYEVKDGDTLGDLLLKFVPERHVEKSKNWKEEIFRMARGEIVFDKNGTPILDKYVIILMKGKSPSLSYRLRNGDKVAILLPIGGG